MNRKVDSLLSLFVDEGKYFARAGRYIGILLFFFWGTGFSHPAETEGFCNPLQYNIPMQYNTNKLGRPTVACWHSNIFEA